MAQVHDSNTPRDDRTQYKSNQKPSSPVMDGVLIGTGLVYAFLTSFLTTVSGGFLTAKLLRTFGRMAILCIGASAAIGFVAKQIGLVNIDWKKLMKKLEPVVNVANNVHNTASEKGVYRTMWNSIKSAATANVMISLSVVGGALVALY